jgi:L-ribulose-5-phosphate 3-epimerase
MNSLGIYEKALPRTDSWLESLELVKELGFSFFELSIDESDERLARLDWNKEARWEVYKAIWETGIRIHTLMLSGHRRFPMGSLDPAVRETAMEMMRKAIDLASDLGIRNIQLAGYDVYYEPKTLQTRELFIANLRRAVEMAAAKEVMLDIETMDDPFINSLAKIAELKKQIHSPWLQAYPDLGNLTAWLATGIGADLEKNIDLVAAIHLKDTYPVTDASAGKFRDVSFGAGTVDFKGCFQLLRRLGYQGAFTIEMWTEKAADPICEVKKAKKFFDGLFAETGLVQETIGC